MIEGSSPLFVYAPWRSRFGALSAGIPPAKGRARMLALSDLAGEEPAIGGLKLWRW